MEGKLYKTNNNTYVLVDPTKGTYDDGYVLGTSRESQFNKLSIKNCQSIERGYDLDELAEQSRNKVSMLFKDGLHPKSHTVGFRAGWQQAINMMGNKKFSEEDMFDAVMLGCSFEDQGIEGVETYNELKDLAIKRNTQTEWDVLIDMEPYHDGNFIDDGYTHIIEPKWRPALDADGCLILKLKLK